jgi:riboflavin synthase
MFTGLIEEVGSVSSITGIDGGIRLRVVAQKVLSDVHVGASIAVSGICLTVVEYDESGFSVEVTGETLKRSTLSAIRVNRLVNLERAVRADQRLGGHFVQGHVDNVGKVIAVEPQGKSYWVGIELPEDLTAFVVEKGSISIDGVSLTIARIVNRVIDIAVIPQTFKATTLGGIKPGESVNIEVDIFAKYIRKYLQPHIDIESISPEKLSQWGYE